MNFFFLGENVVTVFLSVKLGVAISVELIMGAHSVLYSLVHPWCLLYSFPQ